MSLCSTSPETIDTHKTLETVLSQGRGRKPDCTQGCDRFPEILQNFSEIQILWSLCSVVFLAFALKFPIQTSLSVAPKLPVSLRSGEKCEKLKKTSTPLV